MLPASSHGPVAAEDPTEGTDGDETEAPETDAPETDAPETEAPETEAPDTRGPGDRRPTDATDTHGALVSPRPRWRPRPGFANHGAFVSCVAHMKDATLATIDWTTVTPESCAAAGHGKSADAKAKVAEKKAEHAAAKAAREAARAAAGHGHP